MSISKEQQATIGVGTRLVGKYKGTEHICTVITSAENKSGIAYRLEDGTVYKSPSAAGAAIFNAGLAADAKERTCNGWAFFSIVGADGTKVKAVRDAKKADSEDAGGAAEEIAPTAEDTDEEEEYECGICHDLFPTVEEATAHMESEHQVAVVTS